MTSPAEATQAPGASSAYCKTAAGAAEIAHRNVLRDPRKRSILLLLDGHRSLRTVAQTLGLETAIAESVVAELVRLGLAQEVQPAASSAGHPGLPSNRALEKALARYLGPLAQVVLARHLGETQDRADLIARLAEHLTDESLRAAFVAEVSRLR
jgi:hypothetical protein